MLPTDKDEIYAKSTVLAYSSTGLESCHESHQGGLWTRERLRITVGKESEQRKGKNEKTEPEVNPGKIFRLTHPMLKQILPV